MRRLIIAAALVTAWAGQGLAFSDKQMNVMSHVGQVLAATKICSKIEMSKGTVAMLLAGYGVDLGDPLVSGVIKSKITDTVDAFAGKDEDASCAAVMFLYGPGGANVPDLLRWKN
ncbi:hypothetical protein [Mesorhizobium sp. M0965]|uniref:hypothetical protein n=1 Tax=Mesorhizobium sp. M0965 TaxID=2957036 RepID=UPI00333BD8D9